MRDPGWCLLIPLLGALSACLSTEPAARSATTASPRPPAIFMAGDSTMADKPVIPAQPERGWGQMLPAYFKEGVRIENHAMNGRSSLSFRTEGRWQALLDRVRPGDYVIIQFGHNDEKINAPTRFTGPFGTFASNLVRFAREVRAREACPILATPIARRRFDGDGRPQDTHGDYTIAVRQAAAQAEAPLLDLNRATEDLIRKLGPEPSKRLYMHIAPGEFDRLPEGRKDDTHLNAYGASRVCDLAVEEIEKAVPGLAVWLRRKGTR